MIGSSVETVRPVGNLLLLSFEYFIFIKTIM